MGTQLNELKIARQIALAERSVPELMAIVDNVLELNKMQRNDIGTSRDIPHSKGVVPTEISHPRRLRVKGADTESLRGCGLGSGETGILASDGAQANTTKQDPGSVTPQHATRLTRENDKLCRTGLSILGAAREHLCAHVMTAGDVQAWYLLDELGEQLTDTAYHEFCEADITGPQNSQHNGDIFAPDQFSENDKLCRRCRQTLGVHTFAGWNCPYPHHGRFIELRCQAAYDGSDLRTVACGKECVPGTEFCKEHTEE